MLQSKLHPVDETGAVQINGAFYSCLVHCMMPILADVMTNQFGNYLCQKIIEAADPEILQAVVAQILPRLVDVSLNIHGTRAVQTLIDKVAANVLCGGGMLAHNTLVQVIAALNREVVELTMDMHGNHVIQAFLMIFRASHHPADQDLAGSEMTSQYTQFIFDACMQNCVEIGMHKHGCCVMQRCLEKGTQSQKLQLANFIIEHMKYLIEDPYGNYLV